MQAMTLTEAKRNFSRVFARAKQGETIVLQHGNDFVQLVPCPPPKLNPLRPIGYFAADSETVSLRNSLGEESGPLS